MPGGFTQPKIRGRRIPSDDCTIELDGEEYAVHAGEWVELLPSRSLGEIHEFQKFLNLGVDVLVAQGEADEAERLRTLRDDAYHELCKFLSRRVLRWNWTGLRGEPLKDWNDRDVDPETGEDRGPCYVFPPDTTEAASILGGLQAQEIGWLLQAQRGETPKNAESGSADLQTTSSVSESTEAPRSTTGRSRSKAGSPKSAKLDSPAA